MPGAWREENLEGKATLRAIIAGGRRPAIRAFYLRSRRRAADPSLARRLRDAVAEGRVRSSALLRLGLSNAGPELRRC